VWRMTPAQVVGYIRERKTAGRSNATINRELDIIRGVLKRAKRWHHFSEDIHPLPVRQSIGQALTYEEKVKLLHRAAARPEWQTVACAARLALNTTMRGCEIKEMRWRDVDMMGRSLTVRKSKTEAGERVIPLNADAWAVILELYRRSQTLGATEPSHFLFPACETAHFDPTRGIKSWRTAWRRLTRAVQCAGAVCSRIPARLARLARRALPRSRVPLRGSGSTIYGIRPSRSLPSPRRATKQSCRLQGTSRGRCSRTTRTSGWTQREKRAGRADDGKGKQTDSERTSKGYDTNNHTKVPSDLAFMPQVVDSMVELSGIEPLTSSLRTRRSPS
jgi:hypothetical protein